jgi:pimeloyl-ACP methyl ester carboxylesterase
MPGMSTTTAESMLAVDGVELRVHHSRPSSASSAAPVVILHGWGASLDAIASVTSGLASSLEVVAVDLPGFGSSAPPPEAWSVGRYASLVVALCDSLGFSRFSLLGHSFGARIAIVVASSEPSRVARVLLTGAAGLKPRRKPSYYAKVSVAKVGRVVGAVGGSAGRDLQQKMRGRVASQDWLDASETMRGTFRLVIAEDLSPRLPAVRAPTLLVWGEADEDTPLWMGERMAELLPDGALVKLPGGHYVYAERSAEFNRIAAHFLTEAA